MTDGVERDQPSGATADGRRGASLPVGGLAHRAREVFGRVRRTDRTVLWALGGAAVVIGLVAGTGVGLSIGTRSTAEPATTVTTPAAGTVTLEQMLDLPQTYADQLPGGMDSPVSLHTTRLVFTNRSLAGDDAATPWNVWAGVGRDSSTICLVATADRRQGTSACYPPGRRPARGGLALRHLVERHALAAGRGWRGPWHRDELARAAVLIRGHAPLPLPRVRALERS
ncbi:hypothetical protein [Curtobacterium sp. MCPF17_052]|uniref:hypothetical protein n=1 Tax=Curtobacterium sp. MCPF17_052 TaxID=2175655 RepID=UPI0024DF4718|nr:hypothetical protein [Curtobacterium sp. MCPF17_052]WIB12661.1 hypothetical protein DEJ36_00485 [Curtobacterium sp. MCPF17_052]